MSDGTRIEWAQSTWNPIVGCSPCSDGCSSCYAARMAHRLGRNPATPWYYGTTDTGTRECPGPPMMSGMIREAPDRTWTQLDRWRKPRRVFVCSMGDLFHEHVTTRQWNMVAEAMMAAPQHCYMLLTKRVERMAAAFQSFAECGWEIPRNWWLGVTACNDEEYQRKVPVLLSIPAAVRFVSVEPMLGPINGIAKVYGDTACGRGIGGQTITSGPAPEWIICGGETGPGARPVDPMWVVNLHSQCQTAGIPFFAKKFPHAVRFDVPLRLRDEVHVDNWLATAAACHELPEVTP